MKKLNHYMLYTTDISHLININLSPLSYVPFFISSGGWSFKYTHAKCVCMHTHYKYSIPSVHSIITAWCAWCAKPQIKTENKNKMEKLSQKLLFVQIRREKLIDLYK